MHSMYVSEVFLGFFGLSLLTTLIPREMKRGEDRSGNPRLHNPHRGRPTTMERYDLHHDTDEEMQFRQSR